MNVKTFAKAGDAMDAAVGTGAKPLRTRARRTRKQARKQAKRSRRQLVAQIPGRAAMKRAVRGAGSTAQAALAERPGHLQGDLGDRWEAAQELVTQRVLDARRELAGRIDPKPTRRRRWLWLLLIVIGGVATAAALARRPQPVEEEIGFGSDQPTVPTAEQTAAGSPEGNGVVAAERPSTATD